MKSADYRAKRHLLAQSYAMQDQLIADFEALESFCEGLKGVNDSLREKIADIEGDAATLRGYINTYGETPAMTWSSREHWKNRAVRAELDVEKLKMDAEHLQYERDEAREKLAAEPDPRLREELALYREEYEARHSYGHKQGITSPQAKRYQEAKRKLIVFRALARTPPQKVENRE